MTMLKIMRHDVRADEYEVVVSVDADEAQRIREAMLVLDRLRDKADAVFNERSPNVAYIGRFPSTRYDETSLRLESGCVVITRKKGGVR
jgi:hypothetical protein